MNQQLSDIIAISIIGLIAIVVLVRLIVTTFKHKTASLCNGCTQGSCSKRDFSKQKKIKFYKL